MDKKDFFYLGKITRTSGYTGNLVFFFDVDDIRRYNSLEAVFIHIAGELIPFAISSINIQKSNQALVQLSDVDNVEEAEALVGSDLYLPLSFLPPLTGKKFYFHEVIGFEVHDTNLGLLGVVKEVLAHTGQPVLVVKKGEREILIPAVDEFIVEINRKKRRIAMQVPEGLTDIFL